MRRLIAGTKKAFHRNKRQNEIPGSDQGQNDQLRIDQDQSGQDQSDQTVISLSLPESPPGGFTCWDHRQCRLCSRFLDRWFVLRMFTSKFVNLGTAADLLVWSQAGTRCPLCVYVCLRFINETDGEIPLDASVIVRWNTRDTAEKGGRKDEVPGFDFELSWGFPHGKARSVMMKCFTNEDQKIAHYMTTRPANPDVASPAAFAKAKAWLAECIGEHTQCKRLDSGSSELPSRVLEIAKGENDEYSVRLHESTAQIAAYAALSYIWGKPQTCRTLKSNIDDHKIQIDTKNLPQTIMDAVRCTQQLGLRYLWVDSLCIIQDSQDDKGKEIGRMASIYKNAHVTISAAKAHHCDEGFLQPRTMVENLMKTSFKLEILTPKDPLALNEWIEEYRTNPDFSNYVPIYETEAAFKTSSWNHSDAWYDTASIVWLAGAAFGDGNDLLTATDIEEEPITKRGWTQQESWLSPRMLMYGSAQLIWKCSAGVQVDGGVIGSSPNWDVRNSYEIDEDGDMANEDGSKITGSGKQWIFGTLWKDVVQESSRRELTVPGDKLNALEGIVQELRRQTGDEYLAGLWRQHLVSELSWYQDATSLGSDALLWNSERTCPSWSWIKTDGPVRFSHAENSSVVVEAATITRNETVGEHPNTRLVVEGSITLRAPISTLPIEQSLSTFKFPNPGSSKQAFSNVIYLDGALTNPEFISESMDGSLKLIAPDDMRFMELSWGKMWGSQNVAQESRGLVLVPIEGKPDTYTRAGFFVVALEYDVDHVDGGYNLISMLSVEPGNVRPTEFGTIWKASLEEEVVTIV